MNDKSSKATPDPSLLWTPPEPGLHVIVGPNGVGKTRLLERLPGNPLAATKKRGLARAHDASFEFVRGVLEETFPDHPWMHRYSLFEPTMSDGMKTFVTTLCATITASDIDEIVAIDNLGDGLSPHAIHALFKAIRTWRFRVQMDITAVFATQNPCVLNEFNERSVTNWQEGPENVWIMTVRGHAPSRLTQFADRDWLSRFSLGDLYDRNALPMCPR